MARAHPRVPRPAARRAPRRAGRGGRARRSSGAARCTRRSPRSRPTDARCGRSTSCRSGPTRWSTAVALADLEQPISLDSLMEQFAPGSGDVPRAGRPWKMLAATAAVFVALTLAWRYTPLKELVTADAVIELGRRVRRPMVGAARDRLRLHAGFGRALPAAAADARRGGGVRAVAGIRVRDGRHPARRGRRLLRRAPVRPRHDPPHRGAEARTA